MHLTYLFIAFLEMIDIKYQNAKLKLVKEQSKYLPNHLKTFSSILSEVSSGRAEDSLQKILSLAHSGQTIVKKVTIICKAKYEND